VLVVEHELLIRWSLAEALTAAGMTVQQAEDGRSAIAMLAADQRPGVDVVVLDYRLPDSDGLRLLGAIRHLAPSSQVILMTAFGTPEIVDGARALGVFRIVDKPFDLGAMAALVVDASARRPPG
jgi:DNA-binding NtrC family response regulator